MKICMIGTGYVGLVTGTCFAEVGNEVTCVDVDRAKIERLNQGHIPIFEPGLGPLVQSNQKEKRLHFSTDLVRSVNEADICFIAVGTPPNEDGSADLRHVLEVADQIASNASKTIILGTKSTVPVGTGDKIEEIFKNKARHPFTVFSNPEFLKEGDAVNDFMKPDRVVVGVNDPGVAPLLHELYAPFTRQKDRLIVMGRRSAELTKYAANAMLAARISFMNEMACLCEKVGANVNEIRVGIGADPRIGTAFLFPGLGYGGSCFPKDVRAILQTAREAGSPLQVIQAADEANRNHKQALFRKIQAHYGGLERLKGLKIALWGLAFKAKTDDIRESPALAVLDSLLEAGCRVSAFDPHAAENVRRAYGDRLSYEQHSYDCLNGADGLVIATEWNEFRSPDFVRMRSLMRQAVIFDGRNLLSSPQQHGFIYYGVGLGSTQQGTA